MLDFAIADYSVLALGVVIALMLSAASSQENNKH